MAKTLLRGTWASSSFTTLYTCPSDKYAKVTVLSYLNQSLQTGKNYYGYECYLWVNGRPMISSGYPRQGTGMHYSSETFMNNFEGFVILAPSDTFGIYQNATNQSWLNSDYSILIETVAKTTVEA